MMTKGTLVGWKGKKKIVDSCYLNPKTGELFPKSADLDLKVFTKFYVGGDEDGDEYDVCPACHEYVLKAEMNERIGNTLSEEQVCSDPDCESHEEV